ncbi:MAG: SEC-C metal-binding domain-containing protein [Vicinamibacterales bacterium]
MAKQGRNELCSCGSGKKFKRCHGSKTDTARSSQVLLIAVGIALLGAVAAGIASFSTRQSASSARVWDPAHGHYHDANGTRVP